MKAIGKCHKCKADNSAHVSKETDGWMKQNNVKEMYVVEKCWYCNEYVRMIYNKTKN